MKMLDVGDLYKIFVFKRLCSLNLNGKLFLLSIYFERNTFFSSSFLENLQNKRNIQTSNIRFKAVVHFLFTQEW